MHRSIIALSILLTMLFSWPVRKEIDTYVLWNDYETDADDVNGVFLKVAYRF